MPLACAEASASANIEERRIVEAARAPDAGGVFRRRAVP